MAVQGAIAKAAFQAALSRAEPQSVPREVAEDFSNSMERLIRRCDVENVKTCRVWLTTHVVPSPTRVAHFGKYISSISSDIAATNAHATTNGPSAKRKQIHLLYLINDLLHHTKFVARFNQTNNQLPLKLEQYVVKIMRNAGSVNHKRNAEHIHKVSEIINVWDNKRYFKYEVTKMFREAVIAANTNMTEAPTRGSNTPGDLGVSDDVVDKPPPPFELPATHGDFQRPPFDQPAALLLAAQVKGAHRPARVRQLAPLKFRDHITDDQLIDRVKDILVDVDKHIRDPADDVARNLRPLSRSNDRTVRTCIDELGQLVETNSSSGDRQTRSDYYGWSLKFSGDLRDQAYPGPSAAADLSAHHLPPPPPSIHYGSPAPPPQFQKVFHTDGGASSYGGFYGAGLPQGGRGKAHFSPPRGGAVGRGGSSSWRSR